MNQARLNSKFGIKNAHVLVGALADNRIMLAEWTTARAGVQLSLGKSTNVSEI